MIVYKRNSIGLRGEEPPVPFSGALSIVAIGGSTTECMFISEGKTWEDVLAQKLRMNFPEAWVNNAGFSGHSTFAHIVLLRDYVVALKPRICLFMVGANDLGRTDLRANDEEFSLTKQKWLLTLARRSKLANAILSVYRNHLAKEKSVADNYAFSLMKNVPLQLDDSTIQKAVDAESLLVNEYGSRLKKLIQLCRQNNIEPVFITQPSLVGEGIDSLTSVNLATYRLNDTTNGKQYWKRLELYNNETVQVATASNVFVIDLAHQLPKQSIYFYDMSHFNIPGCATVAELIASKLKPFLKERYPSFQTTK
jgi:lysophospholipase L1-like esterase